MTLSDLKLYRIEIPFHRPFKHSAAERTRTQGLWVEALANGFVGRGEGCPREYVTHETMASAGAFVTEHRAAVLSEIQTLEDLASWERRRAATIDENPAAWCAVELAVLEWFATRDGVPVEDVLSLPRLDGTFRYTAVVGDSDSETYRLTTARYRDSGFADFKLKLSGDLERDREKLRVLQEHRIEGLRVRVDANNLWQDTARAADYLVALDGTFLGIEEPLPAHDLDGLRRLADRTGDRIILDESFLRVDQVALVERDPDRWILNLRVSKLGGLLRTLAILERARQAGIAVIVGAQVGETSLLTRAGLVAASVAGANLLAHEGAFGTLLLQSDLADPPLMFGAGGVLDPAAFDLASKPGWGLPFTEDREALRPLLHD